MRQRNGVNLVVSIQPSADVSDDCTIAEGTRVWHLAQVRENASIGKNCIIGRGAYVGEGVQMGDNCKIQNLAQVYEPAKLGDGVFIGPAVVLTNDQYPRAINEDGSLKDASDWEPVGVNVETGAAVGARSVLVAPVTIGKWALVAAGSTVVKDVPDYALVAGVPAKRIGWVGPAGQPLTKVENAGDIYECPVTGKIFRESNEKLEEIQEND